MSLFKDFHIAERSQLQLRFEDLNVPNSAYVSAPSDTNIDSSAGGQITSTSNNPRQLQFALKYVFCAAFWPVYCFWPGAARLFLSRWGA